MIYRINYKGMVCELIEPSEEKNLNKGVIVFGGLPNQPRNEDFAKNLSQEGFYVLHPRYIGSWESEGDFSIENCMESVKLAEELLLKGRAIECYNEKEIKWKIDKSYILGSSFAPSIFLSIANLLKTKNFVCLCPLTNLFKHNSNKEIPEQNLESIYDFLQRGFKNAFRNFEEGDWKTFIRGKSRANPITHANKIKGKNILLIHGDKDIVVNLSRTEEFYEKIKNKNQVEFKRLNNVGHGKECKEAAFEAILDWLKK